MTDKEETALGHFAEVLVDRMKKGHRNIVMVVGRVGEGKTTFAIQLCSEIAKRLGVNFSLDEDLIFEMKDLDRKINDPNATPINLIDEMVPIIDCDVEEVIKKTEGLVWTNIFIGQMIEPKRKQVDYTVGCSLNKNVTSKEDKIGYFKASKSEINDPEDEMLMPLVGTFDRFPQEGEYRHLKEKVIKNMIERRNEG